MLHDGHDGLEIVCSIVEFKISSDIKICVVPGLVASLFVIVLT